MRRNNKERKVVKFNNRVVAGFSLRFHYLMDNKIISQSYAT